MQTIIWAFGSMLVLTLILFFLPLGFSIKGKMVVVLASFILALGGLTAVASFSLWQMGFMLIALLFFTAYFMDKHIGALMYIEIPSFEEELTEEYELPVSSSQIDMGKNNNSFELAELESIEPSVRKMTDESLLSALPETKQVKDNENGTLEEDISFLLEQKSVNGRNERKEEIEPENGYLSDIESLLDDANEKKIEKVNNAWIDEIKALSPLDDEENLLNHTDSNELETLADSTFDFLYAPKEVAVGKKGDHGEKSETEKRVILQK